MKLYKNKNKHKLLKKLINNIKKIINIKVLIKLIILDESNMYIN
jgi:hypothetical protein